MHKQLSQIGGGNSDFSTLFTIYQLACGAVNMRRWCREHFIHWRAINTARSVHQQLQTLLDKQPNDSPQDENEAAALSAPLSQRLRQALCYGLFGCVARLSPGHRSFRTMDGHSTICYIHPGSALFGREDNLDWVIFYELVDTAKTYMRTLCPIRLKDLLPQLHEVDVYRLSDCEQRREEAVETVATEEDQPPTAKKACVAPRPELKERAFSAGERYLARKNVRK